MVFTDFSFEVAAKTFAFQVPTLQPSTWLLGALLREVSLWRSTAKIPLRIHDCSCTVAQMVAALEYVTQNH
jgi:hypothetical protein